MEKDMDADAEAGDTEERVADLEDALDELKAEFEKMMSGKMGDEEGSEEEKEEESVAPVADPNAELSNGSKT
jgi:ABC-type phosphate transport system auxiliary subunit